jgi:MFS family permease
MGARRWNRLALLEVAGEPSAGVPLRFATGVFLAGVYPPALKLLATWFQEGRGSALGILVGAIIVGQALPHLINGLGGLDWRVVVSSRTPRSSRPSSRKSRVRRTSERR